MAEEVVVKDQLTESMVATGMALTEQLVRADLDVVCALWFYDMESNQWRFLVASPRVDSDGPLRVYEIVQDVLKRPALKASGLKLQNISAIPPSHPVVKAIRSMFKNQAGFTNIRFSRSMINNVLIEDSHIIFLKQDST